MIPQHYVGLALLADSSDSDQDSTHTPTSASSDVPGPATSAATDSTPDPFPPPPRGVLTTVTIQAAGSASVERFDSASAAIARFTLRDGNSQRHQKNIAFPTPPPISTALPHRLRPTAKHGNLTATAADYMAVISALRAVLRHLGQLDVRTDLASLTLGSDNDLVIAQLRGENRVRNASLALLKMIVHSLQARFRHVCFTTSARERTRHSHCAADAARDGVVARATQVPFAPRASGLVNVFVMGVHTRASHDISCACAESAFMIDARFLASLPTVGNSLLRNLNDPFPLSIVTGLVNMTVLGMVDLEIGVSWNVDDFPDGHPAPPTRCAWVNVVVVDWLPVQFHFCTTNRSLKLLPDDGSVGITQLERASYSANSVPERLRAHPYWKAAHDAYGIE